MDKNSMLYWFPKIEELEVQVPKTILVPVDFDLTPIVDGRAVDGERKLRAKLRRAAILLGLPCFLRTSHTSGKHEWAQSCFLIDPSKIHRHVFNLVEFSFWADMLGLPIDAFAVREFLPTEPAFRAFGGMPVTRERRYFISDGAVIGHHPYWPPDSIRRPDDPDWRKRLDAINHESPDEIADLTQLSEHVAKHIDGSWSVDWLYATDRGWVLIDMAEARRSFCWETHPNAPKVNLEELI